MLICMSFWVPGLIDVIFRQAKFYLKWKKAHCTPLSIIRNKALVRLEKAGEDLQVVEIALHGIFHGCRSP